MEFALRKIPPDSLSAVPVDPCGAEIKDEENRSADAADIAKQAGEGSGVDFSRAA